MMTKDEDSKYGTLLHEEKMKIRLGENLKAFQISNIVFSFKIIEDRNYWSLHMIIIYSKIVSF